MTTRYPSSKHDMGCFEWRFPSFPFFPVLNLFAQRFAHPPPVPFSFQGVLSPIFRCRDELQVFTFLL